MSASDKMGKPIRPGDSDVNRPYRCYACSLCFARRSSLVWHNTMHVQEADETDQNISASNKDGMPIEPRATDKNKPYKCNTCSLCFSRRSSLAWHKKTHKSNKHDKSKKTKLKHSSDTISEQKQDQVVKKRIEFDNVKKDIEVKLVNKRNEFDRSKKPYKCSECDLSFTRNSSLIWHKSIHTANSGEMTTCYTTTKGNESEKIPSNVSPKAEQVALTTSKKCDNIIKTCIDTSRKEDKVPDPCIEPLLNKESIKPSSCTEKSAFNARYNQYTPSTTSELAPNENVTVPSDYVQSDDYMNHTIECDLVDPYIEWDEHLWIGENVELSTCSDEPALNEEYNQSHPSTLSTELAANEDFSVSRSRKKDNYVGLDQVKKLSSSSVGEEPVLDQEKSVPSISKKNDTCKNKKHDAPDVIQSSIKSKEIKKRQLNEMSEKQDAVEPYMKDVPVDKGQVNSETNKSISNISNAFGDTKKQAEATANEQLEEQTPSENDNESDTSLITEPKESSSRKEHNQPNSEPSLVKEQNNSNTSAENSYVSASEKSIELSVSENRKEPQDKEIITEQTSSVLSGNESPKNKNYDCVVHDLIKYRKLLKSLNSDICDKSLSTKDISEKHKILHADVKHHKIEPLNQDEKQSTLIMNLEPKVRGHFGTEEEASMENDVCEKPAETDENSNQENDLGHPNENISAVSSRRSMERDNTVVIEKPNNDTKQRESDWTENKSDLIKQCIQMWDRIGVEQSSDGMNVSREESNDSSLCEELNENSHSEHDNSKSSKYENINKEMIGTRITGEPNSLMNENIGKEIVRAPITHEPNSSNKENIRKELVETHISDVPNLSKNENISKELHKTRMTNEPSSSKNENTSKELVGTHITNEPKLSKNDEMSKELAGTHIPKELNSGMRETFREELVRTHITNAPNPKNNESIREELVGTCITNEPNPKNNENIGGELVGTLMTNEPNPKNNENIREELVGTLMTNEPNSKNNENISEGLVGTLMTNEPNSVNIRERVVGTFVTNKPGADDHQYRCLTCNSHFSTDQEVFNHCLLHKNNLSATHNSEAEKSQKSNILECYICKRICQSKHRLKQHILGHEGNKPFLCETCGKTFQSKHKLFIHQRGGIRKCTERIVMYGFGLRKPIIQKTGSDDIDKRLKDLNIRLMSANLKEIKQSISKKAESVPIESTSNMHGWSETEETNVIHQNETVKKCAEHVIIPNFGMKPIENKSCSDKADKNLEDRDAHDKLANLEEIRQSIPMTAEPLPIESTSRVLDLSETEETNVIHQEGEVEKCAEHVIIPNFGMKPIENKSYSDKIDKNLEDRDANDKLANLEEIRQSIPMTAEPLPIESTSRVPDLSETEETNVIHQNETVKKCAEHVIIPNFGMKPIENKSCSDKTDKNLEDRDAHDKLANLEEIKQFIPMGTLFYWNYSIGLTILSGPLPIESTSRVTELSEAEETNVIHQGEVEKCAEHVINPNFSMKPITNKSCSDKTDKNLEDRDAHDKLANLEEIKQSIPMTAEPLPIESTSRVSDLSETEETNVIHQEEEVKKCSIKKRKLKRSKEVKQSFPKKTGSVPTKSTSNLRKRPPSNKYSSDFRKSEPSLNKNIIGSNNEMSNLRCKKPYQCPFCELRFSRESGLISHKTMHKVVEEEASGVSVEDSCDDSMDDKLFHPERDMADLSKTSSESNVDEANDIRDMNKKLISTRKKVNAWHKEPDVLTGSINAGKKRGQKKVYKKDRPFECVICLKSFVKRYLLITHMKGHFEGKTDCCPRHFQCSTCGKAFHNEHNLKEHEREVHTDEKKFKCDICGYRFSRRRRLIQHRLSHTHNSPRCDGGHRNSVSAEIEIEENANQTNAEESYHCIKEDGEGCSSKEEKVNKGNESRANYEMNDSNSKQNKLHIGEVEPTGGTISHSNREINDRGKKLQKQHCVVSKTIRPIQKNTPATNDNHHRREKSSLKMTSPTEITELTKNITNCHARKRCFGKNTNDGDGRIKNCCSKLHVHRNDGSSLSHNERCDNAVMLSHDELRKHKNLDGWLINGKFNSVNNNETNVAEKQPNTNKDLNENLGGVEQLKCPICSNYFSSKDLLKEHFVSHIDMELINSVRQKSETISNATLVNITSPANSNLFECSYCTKMFSRKGDLNEHIKIHTGESKYKCDICLKYFSKGSNLIRHMVMHSGLKPHICDFCQKPFAEKHKLKQHKAIHTREKSCKCNVCGERFAKISNLTDHKKTHESLTPHQCDLCGESFQKFRQLFVHKLSHLVKDDKSDTKKKNIKGRQSQKGAAHTKSTLKTAAKERNRKQLNKKSASVKKPKYTVRRKIETRSRSERVHGKKSGSKKMCPKGTFGKRDIGKKSVTKRKRLWDGSSSYDSEQNQEHTVKKTVRRSKRFRGKRPARYMEQDENDIDNAPVKRSKRILEVNLTSDSEEAETNKGDEPIESRKLCGENPGDDSKEDETDVHREHVERSEIFCEENPTDDSEKQINIVDEIIIKKQIEGISNNEPAIDETIDCRCGACFSQREEWIKHRSSGECEKILVKLREFNPK